MTCIVKAGLVCATAFRLLENEVFFIELRTF